MRQRAQNKTAMRGLCGCEGEDSAREEGGVRQRMRRGEGEKRRGPREETEKGDIERRKKEMVRELQREGEHLPDQTSVCNNM